MAYQYKPGEVKVMMKRGRYHLYVVLENARPGLDLQGFDDFYDRESAHEIQYMMNGWGLPMFVIGNTQEDYVRAAIRTAERHYFSRERGWELKEREWKANAECFKAILALIESPAKVAALKSLWMFFYESAMVKKEQGDLFDWNAYDEAKRNKLSAVREAA